MTRNHVKETAIEMVRESGLINLSRLDLCKRAGIPDGSFPHMMGCNFSEFIKELREYDRKIHPVHKKRVDPSLRKGQILGAAITLSKIDGYHKITRDNIADKAGISVGLVTRYFGTMTNLRRAIMRAAITQNIPEIVAQGLANKDNHARRAPPELRAAAIKIMTDY